MSDLTTKAAEIRAGLEGVTSGPWHVSRSGANARVYSGGTVIVAASPKACPARNAAHIARLDPATVLAFLDERDQHLALKQAAELAEARVENERLRAALREGRLEAIRIASEVANGVEPSLLEGMSERYVSIYCAARRDAADSIKAIPSAGCEYCGDGKITSLPGNACENCMNTGLQYPEFSK